MVLGSLVVVVLDGESYISALSLKINLNKCIGHEPCSLVTLPTQEQVFISFSPIIVTLKFEEVKNKK